MTVGWRFTDQNLSAGWRGEFAADQEDIGPGGRRTGGYGVHGLFVTWTPDQGPFEGLEVRAAVDNVLDKQFRRHLQSLDAEGRTFKLTLARTF